MVKHAGTALLAAIFFFGHAGNSHANDEFSAYRAGDVSVVRLADKKGGVPPEVFVGADKTMLENVLQGGICPAMFLTFLIKSPTDLILVDTGNGEARQGRTLDLLKRQGVSKEDITKILLTHMHGDHVQGLFSGDSKTFPHADVYVERSEYSFWTDRKNLARAPAGMAPCFDSAEKLSRLYRDKIRLFTAGEKIFPWLSSIAMPGHTEGHSGFLLTRGGKNILLAGDFLHCLSVQTPHPDVAVIWDSDKDMARSTRKKILERVADSDVIVLGGHFANPGAVLFKKKDRTYSYEFVQPDAR